MLDLNLDLPSEILARGKAGGGFGVCHSLISSWENHVRALISFSNISGAQSCMHEFMYLPHTIFWVTYFFCEVSDHYSRFFNSLEL